MNSKITIDDIIQSTGGALLSQEKDGFLSVGTDTRKSLQGQLFVALKGDNYDANDYLDKAVEAGASGLLIHRWDERFDVLKKQVTIILVNDTLVALQQLGIHRRRQWGKSIIGITGSNGKTTTKEFTAQILSTFKKVHYNQGSFNNHWGLPLTLLGLQPEHEVAICEMGMNHPGEIRDLVSMAEPTIVGVTMVGRAHLEGLGSIEAVASAKEEIYTTPTPNLSHGIFNLDNEWTAKMMVPFKASNHKYITFSSTLPEADVCLAIDSMELDQIKLSGTIRGVKNSVNLSVFGKQNITNIMFAACVGLAVGLTAEQIWQALPNCKTTWGRNQRIPHPQGAEFLFDGYNANPDSQKALIENLKLLRLDRPLIGVFGEMRELGSQSPLLHEELGELVSTVKFDHVFFVGNYGDDFKKGFSKKSPSKSHFASFKDIDAQFLEQLKTLIPQKPLITIKGSRGVRLERILKEFGLLSSY
jgi:UDP-N-acetylmuramoyl-tripeptide--D-alanyl-D-alanine ligase